MQKSYGRQKVPKQKKREETGVQGRENVVPWQITHQDLTSPFIKLKSGLPVHLGVDPRADLGPSGGIISLR